MWTVATKIWPVLVFFATWELVVRVFSLPEYILPSPWRVVLRVHESWDLLRPHALISMTEIFVGFLAASVGGFLIAVGIVHSRGLEVAVEPFVVVSQVVPKVALAPLFIIWFGHGIEPKIVVATLIAFFPVLVNTVLGLRAVDREIRELMDSVAASPQQLFWKVRLPNSLPFVLPALRIAALLSVVGAMVGEFVGADKGLGYLMVVGDVNLDTELIFAALLIVTVIGLVLYGSIGAAERIVARRYGTGDHQRIVTI